MTQASDAMKLAASSGMTLKEAWAQIKGEAGEVSSPAASSAERGTHTLATLKARQEAW